MYLSPSAAEIQEGLNLLLGLFALVMLVGMAATAWGLRVLYGARGDSAWEKFGGMTLFGVVILLLGASGSFITLFVSPNGLLYGAIPVPNLSSQSVMLAGLALLALVGYAIHLVARAPLLGAKEATAR